MGVMERVFGSMMGVGGLMVGIVSFVVGGMRGRIGGPVEVVVRCLWRTRVRLTGGGILVPGGEGADVDFTLVAMDSCFGLSTRISSFFSTFFVVGV